MNPQVGLGAQVRATVHYAAEIGASKGTRRARMDSCRPARSSEPRSRRPAGYRYWPLEPTIVVMTRFARSTSVCLRRAFSIASTCPVSWTDSADAREWLRPCYRKKEAPVQPTRVTANLSVPDIDEARDFYMDYLGLSVEQLNMGWVARFQTPDGRAVVQLVTRDATAPHDSVISVAVGDGVEEAYEEAKRRGFEIVHPLTTEPWGMRRFLVRAPDGNLINVNSHRDD
jgi:predicted enzyme related to lactoylglutathione lyase